jgi:serine phosphatase RsbU (regulator of sigma subunit)
MTPAEIFDNPLFQKAFDRALEEKVEIVEYRQVGSNYIYEVTSGTHFEVNYHVTQNGKKLSCDCPAGRRGIYCKHRAAVSAWRVEQYELAQQAKSDLETLREAAKSAQAEYERLNEEYERADWAMKEAISYAKAASERALDARILARELAEELRSREAVDQLIAAVPARSEAQNRQAFRDYMYRVESEQW